MVVLSIPIRQLTMTLVTTLLASNLTNVVTDLNSSILFLHTHSERICNVGKNLFVKREMEKSIKVENAVQRFLMNTNKCNRICTIYFLQLVR